jgi:hypothetical protein
MSNGQYSGCVQMGDRKVERVSWRGRGNRNRCASMARPSGRQPEGQSQSRGIEFLGTLPISWPLLSRRLPWRLHMHGPSTSMFAMSEAP